MAIARSQRTLDNAKDPISVLRNSGFEDVKIDQEMELTSTSNLLQEAYKVVDLPDNQFDM